MKIGAIMFDRESVYAKDRALSSIEGGWASVEGEQAQRFLSIHELPSDVYWFTNLSFHDFYSMNLFQHPSFRNEGWLRTSFRQIAHELGLDTGASPDVAVRNIALVASRVVSLAKRNAIVTRLHSGKFNEDINIGTGIDFTAISRTPDLAQRAFDNIAEHAAVSVLKGSNYEAGQKTITLRANRVFHARKILQSPVPHGISWTLRHPEFGGHDHDALDALETPFLLNITVSDVNPLVSEVLSFGSGAKAPREWITDTEWRVIRDIADIQINAVLVSTEPARISKLASFLPSGRLDELSYSCGLFAEQLWTSLTNPVKQRMNGKHYAAIAAWYRAIDRSTMFQYAQKLHSRGLSILSYGVGAITLRYPDNGLGAILEAGIDLGLLPPISKVMENSSQQRN